MIARITSVEQAFASNGAEYRKVTVVDEKGKETTKSVFDNLKERWDLLKENVWLDWKMVKKGQFWNVADINIVGLPSTQPSDKVLPQHQEVIDEAESIPPPVPQAVGMMTNNICQLIIADKLNAVFGEKIAPKLTEWYRGQALGITRIDFNGKDLPQEQIPEQDNQEATKPDSERVKGFFKYLENHGIQDIRLWLSVEYGIDPAEPLTPKRCEALYKIITKREKWAT